MQFDLEGIVLAILLVGLVLLGALAVLWVKRWHAAHQAPLPPTRIEDYRALMEKGLLDPQEFERIRDRLAMRDQLAKRDPPAERDAPPPPADPR
jgi:hypothetical protein